jgi:hypothetical protein
MSIRFSHPHACAVILTSCMMVEFAPPATAQVSIGIGLPSVSIGINVPLYPHLVPVPGYPVYYDPRLHSNLFFYDGLYWVYAEDNWYASSWYNGPWDLISSEMVPDFVLRVPLRFYRRPPQYFLGWDRDAPPRWGEHWGRDWDERRHGWDQWDRAAIPERAPLPTYQREYARNHYPSAERQRELRDRNYHYRPREEVARHHFEQAPDREHEPHRPPSEHQHPMVPPSGDSRQSADRSPVERRRVPSPPGRDSANGQHGQPDHRAPDEHGHSDPRAPIERGRPNAPSPNIRQGNAPMPAGRPPTTERRGPPSPSTRNATQAPHSQPDHRDVQRAPPGPKPQEHRAAAQEPAQGSPPSRPKNDRPPP